MKQNGFENLDEETLQQFSSVFKHFMGVNDDEVPFVDLHVFIRVHSILTIFTLTGQRRRRSG
jgi:hypothetical protein